MAEKPEKPMEDLSSEELREQIERDKKQAKNSLFLSFTALIAIIALCIAWFVANNIANAGSSSISGKSDNAFLLASVGTYTNSLNKELGLTDGSKQKFDSYIDLEDNKEVTVEGGRTYHVGTADLSWYLNRNSKFSPGSSGKLEFYIIPQFDGLKTAQFTITMDAYTTISENGTTAPSKSTDTKAQNLINGHILLFQNLDDTKGYSNWLYDYSSDKGTNTLTVNAPDGGTFQSGMPYKVTIYWVWPKYFRNYIYGSRVLFGDLFTTADSSNTDWSNLNTFVNKQTAWDSSKLFTHKSGTGMITNQVINGDMSESVLNTCSEAYDFADEYIGSQVKYVYINAVLK